MKKLILIIGLILVSSLLFGCTNELTTMEKICTDRCPSRQISIIVDENVKIHNQEVKDCVFNCIKELNGCDVNG